MRKPREYFYLDIVFDGISWSSRYSSLLRFVENKTDWAGKQISHCIRLSEFDTIMHGKSKVSVRFDPSVGLVLSGNFYKTRIGNSSSIVAEK